MARSKEAEENNKIKHRDYELAMHQHIGLLGDIHQEVKKRFEIIRSIESILRCQRKKKEIIERNPHSKLNCDHLRITETTTDENCSSLPESLTVKIDSLSHAGSNMLSTSGSVAIQTAESTSSSTISTSLNTIQPRHDSVLPASPNITVGRPLDDADIILPTAKRRRLSQISPPTSAPAAIIGSPSSKEPEELGLHSMIQPSNQGSVSQSCDYTNNVNDFSISDVVGRPIDINSNLTQFIDASCVQSPAHVSQIESWCSNPQQAIAVPKNVHFSEETPNGFPRNAIDTENPRIQTNKGCDSGLSTKMNPKWVKVQSSFTENYFSYQNNKQNLTNQIVHHDNKNFPVNSDVDKTVSLLQSSSISQFAYPQSYESSTSTTNDHQSYYSKLSMDSSLPTNGLI